MPRFPELAVDKIYLIIKDDKDTLAYLPDYINDKKTTTKKWLCNFVTQYFIDVSRQ